MRTRTLVALCLAAVTVAIVPAADARSIATVPDFWTGSWPAFLMKDGAITDPLGTLRWSQLRHEDGVSMLGHNFGGRNFEGCSTDPGTIFFRGRYVDGGDLVACTSGADGKTILGRFNGNELLRSGSFTISIVRDDDKRVFVGKYFEDDGIVTDWCGSLERVSAPVPVAVDTVAPTVRALASSGRTGTLVSLRFRVSEKSVVKLTVRRGARVVATLSRSVLAGARTVRWRAPKRLAGTLRFSVVATDAAGNASASSAASLRLS